MTEFERIVFLRSMSMAIDYIRSQIIDNAGNDQIVQALQETLEHLKEAQSGVSMANKFLEV